MSDCIQQFFAGTYSRAGGFLSRAGGKGIVTCTFDPSTGRVRESGVCREVMNATYLAKAPRGDILFAADDRFAFSGKIKAFAVDPSGHLTLLAAADVRAADICHVACSRDSNRVLISSYGSGKIIYYRFDGNNFFPAQTVAYDGSGFDTVRQDASHIHQAVFSPDDERLYVCDLGSDKIWIHHFSYPSEVLKLQQAIHLPPGYGPRHLICHPVLPVVYIFCELNAHLLMYEINGNDNTTLLADFPTLAEASAEIPSGAAVRIHPSEKTLYVSNRSDNSIAVFSIGRGGYLQWKGKISTLGKKPRDFNFDPSGRWVLIANRESNHIIPFKLDPRKGTPTGETAAVFQCGSPVCILFRD